MRNFHAICQTTHDLWVMDACSRCRYNQPMKQVDLDPLIRFIVNASERPVYDITVREIAEKVGRATGTTPSLSAVHKSLERLGVVNGTGKARRWAWKSRQDHE